MRSQARPTEWTCCAAGPQRSYYARLRKFSGSRRWRFGYGFGSPHIVSWLDRVRLPFNVAGPAATVVLAALDDDEFIVRSVENNEHGKRQLAEGFARLGLHAYPTNANFVAVQVPIDAQRAYEELLERGIVVRSGAGLGMPDRLRVTVGTPQENAAFLKALEERVPVWRTEPALVPAAR